MKLIMPIFKFGQNNCNPGWKMSE